MWHFRKLIKAKGTLYIGMIPDNANVKAVCRDSQVNIHPMGVDLVNDVELMQVKDPTDQLITNDSPSSPSQAASWARSSFRATLPYRTSVIPLA